jgi:hypothetical protein
MNSNFKSKFFFALVVSSLIAAPVFAKHGADDGPGSSSSSSGGTSSSSSAGSSSSSGGMSSSSSAGSSSSSGGMSSSSSGTSSSSGEHENEHENEHNGGSSSSSSGVSNNGGNGRNQTTRERIRFKGNMTVVAAAEDLATSKASLKIEHKSETKKNKTKSETELEIKVRFPAIVASLGLDLDTAPAKTFKAELMGDKDNDTVVDLIATCELDHHISNSVQNMYRLKAETKAKNGSVRERQKVGACDALVDIQKATSVVVFHVADDGTTRTDLFQIAK